MYWLLISSSLKFSFRFLRARVGPAHSTVTFGSHMALHMALGLLFLGGGRLTLSTEPLAVAAMVCAFYPKFPTHSNDNRWEGRGGVVDSNTFQAWISAESMISNRYIESVNSFQSFFSPIKSVNLEHSRIC